MSDKDDTISIKVNLGDRYYPLKINSSDEVKIREAADRINQRVERYRNTFTNRDTQDALSITCLQYAIRITELESEEGAVPLVQQMERMVKDLDAYLNPTPPIHP